MQLRRFSRGKPAQRARAGMDEIADAAYVDQRLPLADGGDCSAQTADHALSLWGAMGRWCAPQIATASASAASAETSPAFGSSRRTMKATCDLSAAPEPTIDCFTFRAANSATR